MSQEQAERLRKMAAQEAMGYVERFESDAEAFYRATGFVTPGTPSGTPQSEAHEARRQEAWDRWIAEQKQILRDDLEAGAAALLREKELRAKMERYEDALNEIASWPEGETVNGAFDEPGSARIARAALPPLPEHGEPV